MIKFLIGVAAGAAALFIGAWAWLIHHTHRTPRTPVKEEEDV